MDKRSKEEFIDWVALINFLLMIVNPGTARTIKDFGVSPTITYIFMYMMYWIFVMGVFVMAESINDIHRDRQLERYMQQLEPYKKNRQFLEMELARIEAALPGKKIARRYNMAKCELLKCMIKGLET